MREIYSEFEEFGVFKIKLFILLLSLFFSSLLGAWIELPPTTVNARYLAGVTREAKAAYLLDVNSQTILYGKNEHELLNPGSMTKVVVLDIALDYMEEKGMSLDELVPISAAADYRNAPPQSSLMFLQEGHKVTLGEILMGIAISSGNDATVALAEFMGGSKEEFIRWMNEHVKKAGFPEIHFEDTSGYSPKNLVTAEAMTLFSVHYLKKHPNALPDLHSLREYTYPEIRHGGDLGLPFQIRQNNGNRLIGRYAGADGIKTGYIDEIGYNLVATAEREGRRVIVTVMGAQDPEGSQKRADIAARLMDYAFDQFQEVHLPEVVGSLPLLGGKTPCIDLVLSEPTYLLFPREGGGVLNRTLHLKDNVTRLSAPIHEEMVMGTVAFSFKGEVMREVPILVKPVEFVDWFKWLTDYVKWLGSSLFGG